MITSTGKAIRTEQVDSCVVNDVVKSTATSNGTAGSSEVEQTIITEDELKDTDIVFRQRTKCKNQPNILDGAIAEWSDTYQGAGTKDKRAIACCLTTDLSCKGVRFVTIADKRKKLYEVKQHDDVEVIRKVMRALCRVARTKEARKKASSEACIGSSFQPSESTATTATGNADVQLPVEKKEQAIPKDGDVNVPEEETPVTFETPSWSKDTKEFYESAEEAHKLEDFATDLDAFLSIEQMHSPLTCGYSIPASTSLVNVSYPKPDKLPASVRHRQPATDLGSIACSNGQDQGGSTLDQDEDSLFISPDIFDRAPDESPVGNCPEFLRMESVRQKMLAPARRIKKTRKKEENATTCPFSVTLPSMTPAEQRLSDALQSSYKAEQELSAALIRYERSIAANPLPRVLMGRKRHHRDTLSSDGSSGVPQGWDHRAAATGITTKIHKKN